MWRIHVTFNPFTDTGTDSGTSTGTRACAIAFTRAIGNDHHDSAGRAIAGRRGIRAEPGDRVTRRGRRVVEFRLRRA